MPNKLNTLLATLLVVMSILLMNCSSPGVYNTEDDKLAQKQLNDLVSLGKKPKSPTSDTQILENIPENTSKINTQTGETIQPSTIAADSEALSKTQLATQRAMSNEIRNPFREEESTEDYEIVKITDSSVASQKNQAFTSEGEKLLAQAGYQTVSKGDGSMISNDELKVLCSENYVQLASYDEFTRLAVQCKWNLRNLAKLNKIRSAESFTPINPIITPIQLYNKISQPFKITSVSPKQLDINCSERSIFLTNSNDFSLIAKKCKWKFGQLLTLNQLKKNQPLNKTVLLPPVSRYLLGKHFSEVESNRVNLPNQKNNTQTAPKTQNTSNTPNWCSQRNYLIPKQTTIKKIAQTCSFDSKYLARINRISPKSKLSEATLVLLPKSFNKRIKTKTYKYPFKRNNCNKKNYKIEYAINMGKISTTCQWDLNLLLRLNKLSKKDILNIGKKIVLPNILYQKSANKVAKKKPAKPTKKSNANPYAKLCNKNIYRIGKTEKITNIAKACNWNPNYLISINGINITRQPLRIPPIILLPPAIEKERIQLFKKPRNKQNTQKTDNFMLAKYQTIINPCSKKAIQATQPNILKIATSNCGWDMELLRTLNQLPAKQQPDANQVLFLPAALYDNFGQSENWNWPLTKVVHYRTLSNGAGARIQTENGAQVLTTQRGLITYVSRIADSNNYIVALLHSNGFISIYENLAKVDPFVGTIVETGQTLGTMAKDNNFLVYHLIQNKNAKPLSNILGPKS